MPGAIFAGEPTSSLCGDGAAPAGFVSCSAFPGLSSMEVLMWGIRHRPGGGASPRPWQSRPALRIVVAASAAILAIFGSALPAFAQTSPLQLTKTPDAASVAAPGQIGYTLTLTNTARTAMYSIALTDQLPTTAGTSWTMSPPVLGCRISTGRLSCGFLRLAGGSQVRVHITSPTTRATCGTVSNSASARAATAPRPVSSGTSSITVTCPPSGDVALTESASPSTVPVNGTVTYSFTVKNNGPDPVAHPVVTDTLPVGATFVDFGPGTPTGCSWNSVPRQYTCDVGALASGASTTVTAEFSYANTGSYTDAASVQSELPDPNTANNSATATVTVRALSGDVALTESASPSTVPVNGTVTYSFTVKNNGPDPVAHPVVTDTLPVGATFVDFGPGTPTGCSWNSVPRQYTCDVGALASGASTTVTAEFSYANTGSYTDAASVQSELPDPNTANNSATATVTVT
ncbi:DUF11 domain-containing protein [Kitasatospora sp. NPDC097691]|uniref:DUF11 domain-containing protein n=1 Tax=Kitasatospora sp. NPDC097691 TaxID=3157231 RepID=UPI00331A93C5